MLMLYLVGDMPLNPRVWDECLWTGWACRTWQTWYGNFQRTGRQLLKGNITQGNKRVSRILKFPSAFSSAQVVFSRDPNFGYDYIPNDQRTVISLLGWGGIIYTFQGDSLITLHDPCIWDILGTSKVLDFDGDGYADFMYLINSSLVMKVGVYSILVDNCCPYMLPDGVVERYKKIAIVTTDCVSGVVAAVSATFDGIRYRKNLEWYNP